MSKTPVVSGVFLFALSIIAVGVKLIRHVNVLDWRGFCSMRGLTGFGRTLVEHEVAGDGGGREQFANWCGYFDQMKLETLSLLSRLRLFYPG
jgi:hypothetical protein